MSRRGDTWPAEALETLARCPICESAVVEDSHGGLTDRTFGCAPGVWRFLTCGSCGCWYLSPRPDVASIATAYERYYTHTRGDIDPDPADPSASSASERFRLGIRNGYLNFRLGYTLQPAHAVGRLVSVLSPARAAWMRRVVGHLVREPEERPRLLDVGAGDGLFVERMSRLGWDARGIDVDPDAVGAAEALGRRVELGSVFELRAQLPPRSLDAVILDHSIEHLHDPVKHLEAVCELLRPGGQIVVATPNARSALHRYFKANWVGVEVPRHLTLFTTRSLRTALAKAGFRQPRQLRSANFASLFYGRSLTIAAGRNPYDEEAAPLTAADRMRARGFAALERLTPSLAEELVMTAKAK